MTGERGVGKSTIIRKWIYEHPFLKYGGFLTKNFENDVRIFPLDNSLNGNMNNIILKRNNGVITEFPKVLDNLGLMFVSGTFDIIIMDEIGFVEDNAFIFQKKVLDLIFSDIPVFGVLRDGNSGFRGKVKNIKDLTILNVTTKDIDVIEEQVNKILERIIA